MVILGGMGSTAGVAFAAILLTLLLEYLRFVSGYEWLPEIVRRIAANRMIIYSLVLIALMLLRPQGLFRPPAPPRRFHKMSAPLLDLKKCTIRFGGLTAVADLDLQIGPEMI